MPVTIGRFHRTETLECVSRRIRALGYREETLSVTLRRPGVPGEVRPEVAVRPRTLGWTARGALLGGVLGVLVGAAAVWGSPAGIPVAIGALPTALAVLSALLSGGAAGAAIGAFLGALVDLGVRREEVGDEDVGARNASGGAHEEGGGARGAGGETRTAGTVALEHEPHHDIAAVFRACGCEDVWTVDR